MYHLQLLHHAQQNLHLVQNFQITSGQAATCTRDATLTTQVRMTFSATSTNQVLTGTLNFFKNPFSKIATNITVGYYVGCGISPQNPLTTQFLSFTSGTISTITMSSSSTSVGAENLVLSLSFTPATILKRSGVIQFKVPFWYDAGSSSSNILYMLDTTSVVSTTTTGMTVSSGSLSASSGIYSFTFTLTSEKTSGTVSLQFTQFRNPISNSAKTGFFLSTHADDQTVIDNTTSSQSFPGPTSPATITTTTDSMSFQINGPGTTSTQVASLNRNVFLSFTVNVPLELTCFVRITFPDTVRIDIDESLLAYVGTGFMVASQTIASNALAIKSGYTGTNSLTFPSCLDSSELGQRNQPGTIILSRVVSTRQISPIGTFTVVVAKDQLMTTIIASGTITPSFSMTSGTVSSMSIAPLADAFVQSFTTYTISFVLESSLTSTSIIQITLPSGLDFTSTSTCTLTNQLNIDSTSSCAYSSGVLTITNAFTDSSTNGFDFIASGQTISMVFNGASNAYSSTNAGSWSIRTYNLISAVQRLVDSTTQATSFTPNVAAFASNIAAITISPATNYATTSTYTFEFTLSKKVNSNSRILITPPTGVSLFSSNLDCKQTVSGTTSSRSCSISSGRIQITLTANFAAGSTLIFVVTGFRNARSFLPVSGFLVQTADSSNNIIEFSDDFTATTNVIGSMTSLVVTPSNFTNGATTTYRLQFSSTIPFLTSDIITIQFPSEISFTSSTKCNIGGSTTITCSYTSSTLRVTISASSISTTSFDLRVTNVVNPPNTRTTSAFSNVRSFLTSSSINYNIQQLASSFPTLKMTTAAFVQNYSIASNDSNFDKSAIYTIKFTPFNKISSSSGSMVLKWPTSVTIYSNVSVTVTTSSTLTTYTSLSTTTREIIWEGIFSSGFSSEITIMLNPVQTPMSATDRSGFYIYTYDDADQSFAIDRIEDLKPPIVCENPCRTCLSTNASDCLSCFSDQSLKYLQFSSGFGTCISGCATGFTTNGDTVTNKCMACDASCSTCLDRGIVGDKFICARCASGYNLRSSDGRCFKVCPDGFFQSSSTTCSACASPCSTCSGTSSNCTKCLSSTTTPYLFGNTCLRTCPSGTVLVGTTCVACTKPCATCVDLPTKCLTCSSTSAEKYFYGFSCVSTCPEGTTTNVEKGTCVGCKSGCDVCDEFDQTFCLKCRDGLFIHIGQCVSDCPALYQVNFMRTACIPLQSFPLIYFPHLIICLILFLIVMAAFFKDRKSLILSNTILLCGPIEFISFLVQIYLTFLFADFRYAIFAILAVILYVVINVSFTLYFYFKIAKKDADYSQWEMVNPRTAKAILYISGILSSKVIRLHYSYLFGIDNFKSSFQEPAAFQKALIGFTCGQMSSNILMIIYDLSGFFLDFQWGTQLYIIMLETLIISLVLIALEVWEFFMLNKYLNMASYQQVFSDSVMNASEMDQGFDKKMREDMLKNIMGKVKNNQDLFLNNNLDELFSKFGDRRCNSMIQFDNDKEDDPRRTKSEPASPQSDFKFDKDAYQKDRFPDNVFADSQPPNPLGREGKSYQDMDTQVQGSDIDKILARKGGDFVNFEGSESQRRRDKKNRRRGRKNQYYTQIDAEDDEEVENNDDGPDGDDLDVIKEEDEQEEMRAKAEKKRLKDEEEKKQREAAESQAKKEQDMRDQEEKKQREAVQSKAKQEQDLRDQEEKINQERIQREKDDILRREEQARLQKQEEERLVKEQEELDKKQQEQEAAGVKEQAEEDLKRKTEEAERKKLSELQAAKQVEQKSDQGYEEEKAGVNQNIVNEDSLNDFQKMSHPDAQVEAPPNADKRTFNENDILGDFDRDEKGNVIVLQDEHGNYIDKQGRPVNERGYLISKSTGDIIDNQNNSKMFDKKDIDEQGEIPAPFCVEKYNFNPFNLRGNFDYNKQGQPIILYNKDKQLVDRKGRKVNRKGWLIDNQDNLCDQYMRKKFDKKQLVDDDLPKLFNYGGRRFDILDICGQFDKDSNGNITFRKNKQGQLIDNLGRLVNEKGYLIDANENIINKEGKKIFDKKHLKQGEIPKIFPFTKFKLKNILGTFEMDPLGNPILDRSPSGHLIDREGRRVNRKGYLIDQDGNVINKYGKEMFNKEILDEEDEIPKVFRTGLLKSDSASSLSRLMSEIERNQPFEGDSDYQRIQNEMHKMKREGGQEITARRNSAGTSLDSMMEDTPSNYNIANQRFEGQQKMKQKIQNSNRRQQQIQEEESYGDEEDVGSMHPKRGKKKKRTTLGFRDPSEKDMLMARAYGGVAKTKPSRGQPKNGNNRMMTADSNDNNRNLQKLTGSISGYQKDNQTISRDRLERDAFRDNASHTNQSFLNGTNEPSIMAVPEHHVREQRLKQRKMHELKQRNKAAGAPKGRRGGAGGDPDFEKMFGKDIDEFLEDSDWDIESFGKMSNFSKGTSRSAFGDGRIRGLESIYLQRIETSMKKGKQAKNNQQSKAKFRIMQDRFMDDVDIAKHDHESGVSQGPTRNKNAPFNQSANTTAMAQNRSDANIFAKQKRALNQTQYRD